MAEKVTKKNATMTLVTDLFVKLTNLYKDAYFIRNRIFISGNEPSDRILGIPMCHLEPKYKEALEKLVGREVCFYIPSIQNTKKWLQEQTELEPTDEIREQVKKNFIKTVQNEEVSGKMLMKATEIEERFNPITKKVRWWQCIGDNDELVKTVFDLKAIFNFPIADSEDSSDNGSFVTISKQILPLVTEKNIKNAYIGTTGKIDDDDDLMEVLLDFRFTHFRMMIVYQIVVLPWEPDEGDC